MVHLLSAAFLFLLVIQPCHPWSAVGRHRSNPPRQHSALASTGPSFSECVRAVSAAPTGTAAVAALQVMRAANHQPSAYQYATVISACNRDDDWRTALSLVEEVRTEGLDLSPACYTACLEACALGGNHALGWQLLDGMREERSAGLDATAYECVSRACVPKGRWKRATAVLSLMAKDGVPVSRAAARSALAACAEAGAGRQARALLFDLYDVTPTVAAASMTDAGTQGTKGRQPILSPGSVNIRSGRALLKLDSSAITLALEAYLGRGRVTLASLQSPKEQERTDAAARERENSFSVGGAAAAAVGSGTFGEVSSTSDSSRSSGKQGSVSSVSVNGGSGPGRRGMAGWRIDEALELWTQLTLRGGQPRNSMRQRAGSGSTSNSNGQWDVPAAVAVAAAVAAASPPAACVPDRAAYHTVLLVCARGGRPVAAERILSQMQDDPRFSGSTDHDAVALLVQAYATAGDADGALEALRKTWCSGNEVKGGTDDDKEVSVSGVAPNAAAYTAAVLALVAARRPAQQALLLDAEMQEHGVEPTPASALALLRACARPTRLVRRTTSGNGVNAQSGGDSGGEVPLLVARLAARGMIGLVGSNDLAASSAVRSSGSATGSSGGALFRGAVAACADAGAIDDALDLIADLQRRHRMQAKLHRSPESDSKSASIGAQELNFNVAASTSGPLADTTCLNAVLNALERVGDWRRATALILDMEGPASSSISSADSEPNILGPPNTASMNAALGACVNGVAPVAWANALFESMVDDDIGHFTTGATPSGSSTRSSSDSDQPKEAKLVRPMRNIVSYNHMIRLLVRNSQPRAALQLKAKLDLARANFASADSSSNDPNFFSVGNMWGWTPASSRAWHLRPDNATFNLVLHAARLAGDVGAAVGALDEMIATVEEARQGLLQPAVPSLNDADSSSSSLSNLQASNQGKVEKNAPAGVSRRRYQYRACPPTALAFATAVQACAAAGAWDRALGLLVTMRARGVVADQRLYTTAIGCFSGARNSQRSSENDRYGTDSSNYEVLSTQRSQGSYTSGSGSDSTKGQSARTVPRPAEVLWLLQEMLSSKVQPDRVAYALVLGTMRRAREPAQANRILREMRDRAAAFGTTAGSGAGNGEAQPPWPDLRCYSEAVGALEEAGDTVGADELFELAVSDGVVEPMGSSTKSADGVSAAIEGSQDGDNSKRSSSEAPSAPDVSRAASTVVDLHGFTVPMARAALRAALAHHSQRLGELGFSSAKGFSGVDKRSTKTNSEVVAMNTANKNRNSKDTLANNIDVSLPLQLPALTIVTGRGKGSLGGQSVLRGAVGSMLSEMGLLEQEDNDAASTSDSSTIQDVNGANNVSSGGAATSSKPSAGDISTFRSDSPSANKDGNIDRPKNPGALVVPGVGLLKRFLGGLDGSQSLSLAAEELAADLRERESMREHGRRAQEELGK